MGKTSIVQLGWIQFVILAIISYIALEKMKYHPALVILGAFVYGGLILPLL
ncbi:chromate transporter [Brochothrix thermosphacta DSM 20171 = FSL F6-1036]|nr:chromate transporter [Brochothrix thermosphacta DSM 20171 = FSL F6-1036]